MVPVNMWFIHCDVTTGADTWRDEAVNRYQQQHNLRSVKRMAMRSSRTLDVSSFFHQTYFYVYVMGVASCRVI